MAGLVGLAAAKAVSGFLFPVLAIATGNRSLETGIWRSAGSDRIAESAVSSFLFPARLSSLETGGLETGNSGRSPLSSAGSNCGRFDELDQHTVRVDVRWVVCGGGDEPVVRIPLGEDVTNQGARLVVAVL